LKLEEAFNKEEYSSKRSQLLNKNSSEIRNLLPPKEDEDQEEILRNELD
jgi:hypothetical protein